MPNWLRVTGTWGSILVILALVISLLKQIIGFIGFVTFVIKIGIFLVFAAIFLGVALLILRSWKTTRDDAKE